MQISAPDCEALTVTPSTSIKVSDYTLGSSSLVVDWSSAFSIDPFPCFDYTYQEIVSPAPVDDNAFTMVYTHGSMSLTIYSNNTAMSDKTSQGTQYFFTISVKTAGGTLLNGLNQVFFFTVNVIDPCYLASLDLSIGVIPENQILYTAG